MTEYSVSNISNVFIIMGASGDLSQKKIYPTLWFLYRQSLLPKDTYFIGYGRSILSVSDIRKKAEPYMKIQKEEISIVDEFFDHHSYLAGSYDVKEDFINLNNLIEKISGENSNRIFYLALHPKVFSTASGMIREICWPKKDVTWGRIIIEKPFGNDLKTFNELSMKISTLFTETEIYRIDHYLGKEMVKNLLVLRFGNIIFEPVWNRNYISNIQITFKENIDVKERGEYFDNTGIIRDIFQNHLLQILSLIAMEKPDSLKSEDIRKEKLKVLEATTSLTLDNLVIGQYIGDGSEENISYTDHAGVHNESITPTYACAVLYINNERWDGVPFILNCGKALNEQKVEILIQFKNITENIFAPGQLKRNELVIRIQPGEAIFVKMMAKKPGMSIVEGIDEVAVEETDLSLIYPEKYKNIRVPDAYENLIFDVFNGFKMDFVYDDELKEAWRIVDDALKELAQRKVEPFQYIFGSHNGPQEATEFMKNFEVYFAKYVYMKGDEPS